MNGAQDLAVAPGATRFAFASDVPSGSSFSVTVKTQTAGQTCTVVNGTGRVAQANVDSVVVDCAAKWQQVAAGTRHSLGLTSDYKLYAWGQNERDHPVLVNLGFSSVTANGTLSFAIKTNGELYAWGLNEYGQLGVSLPVVESAPALLGMGFVAAAACGTDRKSVV